MTETQALGMVRDYCRTMAFTLTPAQVGYATSFLYVISTVEEELAVAVKRAVTAALRQ